MRSNTCGGGPSMDSKVMVGPVASVAMAKSLEFVAGPPAAQPPSAHAAARHNAIAPARNSVRCGRAEVFDASLIVAFGDIAKTAQRLEQEKHREGMKSDRSGRIIAMMLREWRRYLFFKRNRVDMPAVIRLLAMHGPSIAEEALVGIGVDAEIVNHQDAGIFQPHADEAGEIEHSVTVALARQEEQCVLRVGVDETFDELAADFVARLADQGADRGDHAIAVGAELLHRIDGRFQDA